MKKYLLIISFTANLFSQSNQRGEILSETPLYPLPEDMTFEEYQDMNRRMSIGVGLAFIPIPGIVHRYAGEKELAKRLSYVSIGGFFSLIGALIETPCRGVGSTGIEITNSCSTITPGFWYEPEPVDWKGIQLGLLDEVTLLASTQGATASKSIYVRLLDINDAPTFDTDSISDVEENQITVVTLAASDEDSNTTLTYALVDSSKIKILGFLYKALATPILCFWPTERLYPLSPTIVSIFLGREFIVSFNWATLMESLNLIYYQFHGRILEDI